MPTSYLARFTKALAASRRGATAIEYGVLAALVAVAVAAAVSPLGDALEASFTETGALL